jgi:hypothetical protein
MTRLLAIATLLYLPHLAEEAMTGMHDDPIIALALAPLLTLAPRHAVYLMFQGMLLVTLTTTLMFARGGLTRLFVVGAVGLALLGESHHLCRALFTLRYNPGLVTSLPMPLFGAHLLRVVRRAWPTSDLSLPLRT